MDGRPERPIGDEIEARPLTREAFAPFGDVLSDEGLEPLAVNLYRNTTRLYRPARVEADDQQELLLQRSRLRPFTVTHLERHARIAQLFLALDGGPFVVVVAAPDAPERNGLPAPAAVHAFLVPGGTGVVLHRSTWHEPPYPLADGTRFLISSHAALTEGLEELTKGGEGAAEAVRARARDLDVDKRPLAAHGVPEIRIALPR